MRWLLSTVLLLSSLPTHADSLFALSSAEYSYARHLLNRLSDTRKSQSGTLSFRMPEPSMELSVPFLWLGQGKEPVREQDPNCCKHNFATVDLQLRKYQSDRRTGLYAGLVVRGLTSNGHVDGIFQRDTTFGAGATLGYRHLYQNFIYVSTGVTWVSYAEEFEEYDRVRIETADQFRQQHSVTYDFLKVGILFQ